MHLTAIPQRMTPLKQAAPSRSPTATPPQQGAANAAQPSLVGMTKEEKAAEMNRRKEERKQVSGAEFTGSPCPSQLPTTPSQRIAQLKAQKSSGGKA